MEWPPRPEAARLNSHAEDEDEDEGPGKGEGNGGGRIYVRAGAAIHTLIRRHSEETLN